MSKQLEISDDLVREAEQALEISYVKGGVADVPKHMQNQRRLVLWATRAALILSGRKTEQELKDLR